MPRPLWIFLSAIVIFGMCQLDCLLLAQPPKEINNSIGMKLVLIPKVTFMMGVLRVFRGGGWEFGATSGRSATRFFTAPFGRGDWIGFRVALSSSKIAKSPEAGSK